MTTKRMRPGYLRKNGVPYSANAVLTEYFVRLVDEASRNISPSRRWWTTRSISRSPM